MSNNENLIKEYNEREVKWTEKSLSQLSTFNSLILSLSVGFLSFSYKDISLKGLKFTFNDINSSVTFSVLSVLALIISIIYGLSVAANRLIDFRLTRLVNQVRHRMIEHSETKFDETTPDKFNFFKRFCLPFKNLNNYPKITMEECKGFKTYSDGEKNIIKMKFRDLRNISHNAGLNSWNFTGKQTFCFAVSIVFYLLSQFF